MLTKSLQPSDRPTRIRRQNTAYRAEGTINTNSTPINTTTYQQPFPNIAPASSFSPAAVREPLLTSSFQTPVPAIAPAVPSPSQYSAPQQSFASESRFPVIANQSSPIHGTNTIPGGPAVHHPQVISRPASLSQSSQTAQPPIASGEQNGFRSSTSVPPAPQPVRPNPPYAQFCEHMRPQLEADAYPREHIQSRIDEEWRKLSGENRSLWDERYQEQMREYEEQMDEYKRATRTHQSIGNATFRR